MSKWLLSVAGGVALAITVFLIGDQYGRGQEKLKAAKAIIGLQQREATLVTQLETADRRRQEQTRDKIRTVEKIVDNCLDRRLPDDVLRLFPRAPDRPAQPAPDARL